MPSACVSVPTALPSTCGRPGSMGWCPGFLNQVNWLSILTSRRIWTPGAGTIGPLTWESSVRARLLLAAAAAYLVLASTSSAQDDNKPGVKQDARDVGATIKRDTKEAVATVK